MNLPSVSTDLKKAMKKPLPRADDPARVSVWFGA
jgi:hypothetical protein